MSDLNFCVPAMDKTSVEDTKQDAEDNNQTIRPGRSPAAGPVPLPVAKAPSPTIHPISEDADFDFEEDDDTLQEKVVDFKVRVAPPKTLEQRLTAI